MNVSESRDNKSKKLLEDDIAKRTRLYRVRWYILIVYIIYAAINAFQWFEYSIITNVVKDYYNVTSLQVDLTSIIYMALYMPMVVPASYIIDKKGLRTTALIGVTGTAIGTIIKIFSINRNNMWVAYTSQTILSSMQVFILALPTRIASVWFGSREVSSACALGVFGTQLGQALGFYLPPLVMNDANSIEDISKGFSFLFYIMAGFATIITIAVVLYFPGEPLLPPSTTQYTKREKPAEDSIDFVKSIGDLLYDKGYILHMIAYGINVAAFISMSTLLSQILEHYFQNSNEDAGRIGLIMIILGMLGAVLCGFILDRTHIFKEMTLGTYILATISIVLVMYSLESKNLKSSYVSFSLAGFFMNSYLPVGLELGIELTYPQPESTCSGILISMTQTLGVVFTLLFGWILAKFGPFWTLACMTGFMTTGVILTSLIPIRLKRQNAFKMQVLRKNFKLVDGDDDMIP